GSTALMRSVTLVPALSVGTGGEDGSDSSAAAHEAPAGALGIGDGAGPLADAVEAGAGEGMPSSSEGAGSPGTATVGSSAGAMPVGGPATTTAVVVRPETCGVCSSSEAALWAAGDGEGVEAPCGGACPWRTAGWPSGVAGWIITCMRGPLLRTWSTISL